MAAGVGVVRDGAEDDKRDLIEHADLTNRRPFHLAAQPAESLGKFLLCLAVGNKLIPGADPPLKNLLLRRGDSGGRDSTPAQFGVGGKLADRIIVELALRITQRRQIHVMLHRVNGHHDIPDADLAAEGPRNAGENDGFHAVAQDQRLRADTRVHLSPAAMHQHHRAAAQRAPVKGHAGHGLRPGDQHAVFQKRDLVIHGADDADRRPVLFSPHCFFCIHMAFFLAFARP